MQGRLGASLSGHQGARFDSVLLVTGEHEHRWGSPYFRQVLPIIRRHFSTVGMEVQPPGRIRRELNPRPRFGHGLSGDLPRSTYARHHCAATNGTSHGALATPDRLGRAGIDKIGLGRWIGLSSDWRADSYFVAEHPPGLERHHWQSRYRSSRACALHRRALPWMSIASWILAPS